MEFRILQSTTQGTLSMRLSIHELPTHLAIYYLSVSINQSIYLSIYHLAIYTSIIYLYQSIYHLSTYHLAIYLYQSIYLSIIYLSVIYLSMYHLSTI
jgi:hypothetical protein